MSFRPKIEGKFPDFISLTLSVPETTKRQYIDVWDFQFLTYIKPQTSMY